MSYDVTLEGITYPDWNLTFALSDNVTDMAALEGLAVELDSTSANTVKLATDGAAIVGFIFAAENGVNQGEGIVVTVSTKGGIRAKTSAQLSVGDYVVGAGNGAVKAATGGATSDIRVWEVIDATTAVVFQK